MEFNRFLDYYGNTPDLNIPDSYEDRPEEVNGVSGANAEKKLRLGLLRKG